MSPLRLPTITVEMMDGEDAMERTTLQQSRLTSSEAPHLLGQVQMTISLLYAYTDLLKHLSGIATEAAAREIRMEEKRSDK